MHRDEFKRETLLTLCIFKSINVNLKPYMYISLLDSSEIASSSPSLRLGAWFGGPGRGWRSSAETSGRTDKLTEGQPGVLDPASPALPAVPNSRAAPRAAVRSAAPPPAPGSQWGAREEGGARGRRRGRPRRGEATKGRAPGHPAAGALSGHSEGGGRALGTVGLWTRRARDDAAGAVSARREPRRRSGALHRVSGACAAASSGSRVLSSPSPFLAFPRQPCTTLSFLGPLGSSASGAFAGCRKLGGVPGEGGVRWGHTQWAQLRSTRLGLRWPSARGARPSPAGGGEGDKQHRLVKKGGLLAAHRYGWAESWACVYRGWTGEGAKWDSGTEGERAGSFQV